MNTIYILYGSQTGNSEEIAKEIYNELSELGYKCEIKTLNSVKNIKLKEVAKYVIIVCSTTGNGDPPNNA